MIARTTPLEDLPECLTPQDIADYMKLDRWTVYQMMKIPQDKGGIPNFPLSDAKNASKRTMKRDFIAWIELKSKGSVPDESNDRTHTRVRSKAN